MSPAAAGTRPRLAIHGATGRMGRQLLALAGADPRWESTAVLDTRSDAAAARQADVVVDFSSPAGFRAVLDHCLRSGTPLVSGTTGLDPDDEAAAGAAAGRIAILHAANFSLGVAVLGELLARAAALLPAWQLEILEAHHAGKRDAPSGTALALGRAAAAARGLDFDRVRQPARDGLEAPREAAAIGFASIRAGDIVGEHTALLATAGERLELTHRTTDRAIFARGALDAAAWIVGRAPGRYALADMLAESSARG